MPVEIKLKLDDRDEPVVLTPAQARDLFIQLEMLFGQKPTPALPSPQIPWTNPLIPTQPIAPYQPYQPVWYRYDQGSITGDALPSAAMFTLRDPKLDWQSSTQLLVSFDGQ